MFERQAIDLIVLGVNFSLRSVLWISTNEETAIVAYEQKNVNCTFICLTLKNKTAACVRRDRVGRNNVRGYKIALVLTRVKVGRGDCDDACGQRHVLEHLVAVAHGVEEWCVVVEVQDVEVDGKGRGKAGTSSVLGLHHEDVVLHLLKINKFR